MVLSTLTNAVRPRQSELFMGFPVESLITPQVSMLLGIAKRQFHCICSVSRIPAFHKIQFMVNSEQMQFCIAWAV